MHAWQGITPITVAPLRIDRLGTQYKFIFYQKQKTVGKKRSPGQNMEKKQKGYSSRKLSSLCSRVAFYRFWPVNC